MDLLPAIDLIGGCVVRLTQGDYQKQTTYSADPVEQAKRFAAAGAKWVHVVDLDGARTGKPAHLEVIGRMCREAKLNVEVGGGVREEKTIDTLLAAGVKRVILGTAALKNWIWFEQLVARTDLAGKLVLGLDARGGKLAVQGWREQVQATPLEVAKRVKGWSLGAIEYTDISTDGMLKGPNVKATRQLAEATDVPVIAAGGVGSVEHLRALRKLPIAGAIVGKALYDGAITIEEALAAMK